MKVTIKDVARAAGVSASTVSRALRDHHRISPEVRDRVKQVAREMDFHPNQMARSLVNRQSQIVAGGIFSIENDKRSIRKGRQILLPPFLDKRIVS